MIGEVKGEFRRGWTTIVAAGVGACSGITGLGFYTFGLFVKPLSHDFGWSRGKISLGMTSITIGTVLCAPAVGWLTDRYGVRKVAAPSLLGLGVGFIALLATGANIMTFYLACFALAVLGCATSPVTWTRAVSMVFHRRRGLALGLTLLGSALAGLIGVPAVQGMINLYGWRAGYGVMSAFAILFAFPIVLGALRKAPSSSSALDPMQQGATFMEALRTAPFWILGVGVLALITAQSGIIIHFMPLLTDRGVRPETAAGVVGLMSASIFISRIGVGHLLDSLNPPVVAGVVLLGPAVAAILLAIGGRDLAMLGSAAALLGMSAGAEIDLLAYFTGRYFGLRAYGRIYGALFALFSVGNGLGAPLMGAAFDHWRNYDIALFVAAGLFMLGAALFASLGLHPYNAHSREGSEPA